MEINDIVKILNRFHESVYKDKSFYVLQKTAVRSGVAGAYKRYTWILWFISESGEKLRAYTVVYTARVVSDTEKKDIEALMTERMLEGIYGIIYNGGVFKDNGDTDRRDQQWGPYKD